MERYQSKLSLVETERAIKFVKDTFERELADALRLSRVSAPLFVRRDSGLNDDLTGVERSVAFDIGETGQMAEVVHSLAKWKRHALGQYGFPMHTGIYTDMNAIRRDETTDALHSLYVDQWDWEKVISAEDRNPAYLQQTVRTIWGVIRDVAEKVGQRYLELTTEWPADITFISAQALEDEFPDLEPPQREYEAAKRYGALFLTGIGGALKSGRRHDARAPDYDDWNLNGDIIVYYPLLNCAVELSSMGIRVDSESLRRQLAIAEKEERLALPFHKALLNNELPLTMGGGIGQSRLCLLMLQKAHIGEVQASVWPDAMTETCKKNNIFLL